MALAKRFLSIALSLALLFTLLVPALATESDPAAPEIIVVQDGEEDPPGENENDEPDPYAPVITQHLPEGQIYTRTGFNLRLRVAAQLPEMPEGIEGTLSYAWSYKGERESTWIDLPSVTGEKFVQKMAMDMVKSSGMKQIFRVVVTNTYVDEEGNAQTDSAESETQIYFTTNMIEFFPFIFSNINSDYWFLAPIEIPMAFFYCLFGNICAYAETLIRWIRYH